MLFACARLQNDVRLDLCLNFDQVWKQCWSYPKKVLHRTFDSARLNDLLKGKRNEAVEEMFKMSGQGAEWPFKRRRVRGLGKYNHMSVQIYTCI